MDYSEFLSNKKVIDPDTGFDVNREDLNENLFDFQRDIVRWALKRGRACVWADCGLGKTLIQLSWAHQVAMHTGKPVLILAPLAVSKQTIREGEKFGIQVDLLESDNHGNGVYITNYEKMHKFNLELFSGIVLDESSILKAFTGKTKQSIIAETSRMKYRLACTATPAPNDFMEIGNHAEFSGVMRSSEMLAAFFINDPACVGKYRIKGHAESLFWEWVCSWAVMLRKPSDLGYNDDGYDLPALKMNSIVIHSKQNIEGMLFPIVAHTMQERRLARKSSLECRVKKVAELVNNSDGQHLVFCDLNAESKLLAKLIDDSVEVCGADSDESKEERLFKFIQGKVKVLVTKPSIAGYGLNLQNCSQISFTGLSDSFEQFYQAVRRCWRFGQKNEVNVNIVTADTEGAVVANIERKRKQAEMLFNGMVEEMREKSIDNVRTDNGFAVKYVADDVFNMPLFN